MRHKADNRMGSEADLNRAIASCLLCGLIADVWHRGADFRFRANSGHGLSSADRRAVTPALNPVRAFIG